MSATDIYSTTPIDCVESPAGRYRFAPGKRVSRLPFIDRVTGLRARVTYATAVIVAAAVGGRLATAQEEELLARQSFFVRPTIVRETPDEAAARVKLGQGLDHSLDHMASIAWARRCDDDAIAQLEAWDGDRPVMNWGKQWISRDLLDRAPGPAQALNEGWDDDPNPDRTHWIQTVGGAHNRAHTDYSQILMVVWDEDAESDVAHPDALGDRTLLFGVIARAESYWLNLWHRAIDVASAASTNAGSSLPVVPTKTPPPPPISTRFWTTWDPELPSITRVVPSPHCRVTPAGVIRQIDEVVIHTAECSRTSSAAEGLGAFFAAGSTTVSAHASGDNDSIVQSVRLKDVAWAAPPLNDTGVHIELAGRASQTVVDWGDDYCTAQLALAARFVREVCDRFAIPIAFVDVAGLRVRQRGITTHKCVSDAFHQSTHQDPGPAFPMEHFLDLVRDS
jgi:hypothetical protein